MEPTVNPTAADHAAGTTITTTTTQGPDFAATHHDSTTSENPLTGVTNSIASAAESSIREAKNRFTTVAANESVQGVWEQVRLMATGRNGETQVDTSPNQDEIDNMDNEKIAEFLRERNRSDTRRPKRR
ncbi:hypothetical protein BDV26DRAFT_288045 [Aspergillus bertholletiae]|uniref:Uncharacterized protein n=1 Tax=Aspergillus bertholletiae TaxID=1226010 RepID=A0A5N7BN00_9EURO|nr:hypothetical protein BDV26DRAFT_288045 [Aspergillus bertholletiae]